MKTGKKQNKLFLSKETIARLNAPEMSSLKGGLSVHTISCPGYPKCDIDTSRQICN